MKVDITPDVNDPLPLMLFEAHLIGAQVKSDNTTPCTYCREAMQYNDTKVVMREHFHGSDFGACKRKVFNLLTLGYKVRSNDAVFLMDGHLHEHSMLSNLQAGLPDGWRIIPSENSSQKEMNVLGIQLVGHTDGLLVNDNDIYLIECKAIKDYTFNKVKDGEISDEWYGQIQSYLCMMQLDIAYLFVKHRNTSKLLPPIRIAKNAKYIAERLNALKEIHSRLINGMEQPNREHISSKDSECKFCPFGNEIGNKTCWENK